MTGKAVVRGFRQPVERRPGLPDEGVGAGDVVLRMMVVTVRFSVFDRSLDFTSRLGFVSGERREDRPEAVEECHALLARSDAFGQAIGLRAVSAANQRVSQLIAFPRLFRPDDRILRDRDGLLP